MTHKPVGMILTAGFGTRLRPLSLQRPKPIMEIAAKPIIHFLIRMLENAGIDDVFLNLHHQAEQIRQTINEGDFKARIHLVYEKEILGTAGGIANVIRSFGIKNRSLVVIHGDIICDIDLKPYVDQENLCTLICAKNHVVPGYVGSVGVNQNSNIVELGRFFKSSEDVKERGFFTGIHILSPRAVAMVGESFEHNLVAEVYPRWLKNGFPITGIVRTLHYDDLGTAGRIFHANRAVTSGVHLQNIDVIEGLSPLPNYPGIFVGAHAEIAATARITPPMIIGPHAKIEDFATVGPHVVVGAHAIIGSHAHVKNSVIFSKTKIEKDETLHCMIALSSARVVVKDSRR